MDGIETDMNGRSDCRLGAEAWLPFSLWLGSSF